MEIKCCAAKLIVLGENNPMYCKFSKQILLNIVEWVEFKNINPIENLA